MVVSCYRMIRTDGSYAYGVERKTRLLKRERRGD
jgi:O6-methylguanine-DNA--protein-cysteine methyltransferase